MFENPFSELVFSVCQKFVETKEGCCLDIGCGNGDSVADFIDMGYDAYGCDVEFKTGKSLDDLRSKDKLRKILISGAGRADVGSSNAEYAYPFTDESFDFIFSRAVIEHVFNHYEFAQENFRVLKDGGIAIHYFPSKFSLIECHTGILFGALFQNIQYYRFMCKLGLCFSSYKGRGADALMYMQNSTCYLPSTKIIEIFEENGLRLVARPTNLILKYFGQGRFYFISKIPFATIVWRKFRTEVIIFEK